MGIAGLWDVIGKGDVVAIAKYATDHFQKHGRPLRVAVDEPGWRFNNLTPQAVAIIREKEPAANPIEKTIMWRLFHLLKYNIQMIWVFDGPGRPWKRNKRGGGGSPKDEYERTKLLCQLLDHLKVPHHRAPAEAEAECARMQQMGIVDAVWSDDGDSLMFGATCLIGAHRTEKTVNGRKTSNWSKDEIRVHRADKILEQHDLDPESLVLFAMLAGGDYNTTGLAGCGSQVARLVSRTRHGLARALCQASQQDLIAWRLRFLEVLAVEGKRLQIPSNFPDFKALGHYRSPKVSSDEQMRNLNALKYGWDRKIDHKKLRVLLRQRFNVWIKGYMNHVAPIIMIRQLATCARSDDALLTSMKYDVQLKKTRQKKPGPDDDGTEPTQLETKITFYPLPAVDIDVAEPPEEDWSIWEKNGSHYDPAGHVECNVLSCFLEHGLPEGSLVMPEPQQRKKKQSLNATTSAPAATAMASASAPTDNAENTPAKSAPKKRGRAKKNAATVPDDATASEIAPKKRGRPKKDGGTASATPQSKKRKKPSEPDTLPDAPPAVFRLPREISFTSSANSTQIEQPEQHAAVLIEDDPPARPMADPLPRPAGSPKTPRVQAGLRPGEATSPATLRALRAASWNSAAINPPTPTAPVNAVPTSRSEVPADAEVIDLTD